MTFVAVILTLIILGVVAWLVDRAPFISVTFKPFITYVLLAIGALVLIAFLINLLGGNMDFNLRLK